MSVLLVASAEPRVGRSLIAAVVAYRAAREGKAVSLARYAGDDSAEPDAATFASIEHVASPGRPITADGVKAISGDAVVEAPPGSVKELAAKLGARVLVVGTASSHDVDAPKDVIAGRILTRVRAADVPVVSERAGVLAVLAEDRTLAAPSVADIAATLSAQFLHTPDEAATIDRVMIGTVASDAAEPYFGNRVRSCVVTRFDKTDIQLAALLTAPTCMVITGGGAPSPYLVDRVRGRSEPLTLMLAPEGTVETMRQIEGLFGLSRFDGGGKLERAVALLDDAGAPSLLE